MVFISYNLNVSYNQNHHVSWHAPLCRCCIINVFLYIMIYFTGLHETLNLGVWASFILTNETVALTEKERPQVPEGIDVKPEVRTEKLYNYYHILFSMINGNIDNMRQYSSFL